MTISLESFVYLNFISLIGGVASFIIIIFIILVEKKVEMLDIETDKLKLEALLKEAEILNLSNQIKPHLLFNALNTVVSLLYFKQVEKAVAAIFNLSRMLRYTINVKKMSTIDEECRYLQDYLKIQTIRFGDRLEYQLEVDDNIRDIEVPTFSLQPMVENVCKHCLEKVEYTVSILVKGEIIDGLVVVSIQDNGQGIPKDKIERFNEWKLDINDDNDSNEYSGIGLKNVHKRIVFHFGDKYGINIIKKSGTRVEIILPG